MGAECPHSRRLAARLSQSTVMASAGQKEARVTVVDAGSQYRRVRVTVGPRMSSHRFRQHLAHLGLTPWCRDATLRANIRSCAPCQPSSNPYWHAPYCVYTPRSGTMAADYCAAAACATTARPSRQATRRRTEEAGASAARCYSLRSLASPGPRCFAAAALGRSPPLPSSFRLPSIRVLRCKRRAAPRL